MTNVARIKRTDDYGFQGYSHAYTNRLLSADTTADSTIRIRISLGTTTNTIVQKLPTDINNTGISKKVDIEEIKEMVDKISSFRNLDFNWDGYGGTVPSATAIKDAISLLKLLPRAALPTRVGVSNDGEISLLWERESLFADFGVLGDGKYCYFLKDNEDKLYGDDLELTDKISQEVIQKLSK